MDVLQGHVKAAKKKARLGKSKNGLPACSKEHSRPCYSAMPAHRIVKIPATATATAKFERSAQGLHEAKCGSKGETTRRRRHHRRNLIESRPRLIITDQIYPRPSPSAGCICPAVSHEVVQPEVDSNLLQKPKRLKKYSHDGGSRYLQTISSSEAANSSALSFCSRLGGGHRISGTSGSVGRNSAEHPTGRCHRPDSQQALPFNVPEIYQLVDACDAIEALDKNQFPRISLALEASSPEANEQLPDRRRLGTQRLSSEFPDLSPLLSVNANECRTILNDVHLPSSVSVAATNSASSSLTLLSHGDQRSIFHWKGYGTESTGGLDIIGSIPSSPTVMFKQILKDPSWGLTPLIEAETSKCEKFHLADAADDLDDMLDNLHEREGYLSLLWGYLERSHTTGIYEPHRYFVVVWQIQHASKYKYQLDTLFRAVSLLDRCLCSGTLVNRQRLWLLGVACMCIAAKLEETQFSSIISLMEDVCTDTGQQPCFTKEQLIWMETVVLQVINYECLTPTAATFIWLYLWDFRKDREVQTLAFYILCLSLTDYEVLRFRASVISASAVFLTCIILNRVPPLFVMELHWTKPAVCSCVKRLDFLFAEASGMRRYTSDI
ncbi:hypothetical protein GOP47_0005575 [Adiantum capillus-veneris]|uniref:Cyclin-like domain-containing protein n=1 Tax=Adiantum capillus-veneris TaxID=13818 RepID=A0A9D4ZNN9_ADICA|nr:hypothetical protein GOP47_0005575 [Adiantum capillus-veneris]